MGRGFLPVRDAGLLAWSENVVARLQSDPVGYGVSTADVARFADAQSGFALAMTFVTPGVRSRVTVATKDDARRVLESEARRVNGLVQSAGVADAAALIRLGLTARKTNYQRTPSPTAMPQIVVADVRPQLVQLNILQNESTRLVLPDGVALVSIYQKIGGEAPTDAAKWNTGTQFSRARIDLHIDAPLGTPVHFVARYLNRRGEAGPSSDVTSTIALGGVTFGRGLLAA